MHMRHWILGMAVCLGLSWGASVQAQAEYVETPYEEQRVLFDFYFDHPEKIGSALFWVRSLINPLTSPPYNLAPEFLDIKVVLHGTEIAALAQHNYERYSEPVERMRYYAALGVEFKVCGLALQDYGYAAKDLYDFVQVVPSAITELAHWQLEGYALITPTILERHHALEDVR